MKYSSHPVGFATLKEYEEFEKALFVEHTSANALVFKDADGKVVWNSGSTYFANELAFLNDQGFLEI